MEHTITTEATTPCIEPCDQECLVLYTHDECVFCAQMKQLIYAALDKHRLPHHILVEIDITDARRSISQFPTMRLCDTMITGIQPIDRINTNLMRLLLKACFRERLDRHR
jgi:hypothetical protein